MPSNDLMHRFLFDHTDIRGEIVSLNDSYREVLSHNSHPAPVQQLLGEFLAAVSILSSTLKFDGIITLQARGEGPLPLIMAECSHHKGMRGIAKPDEEADFSAFEGTNLQELLGKGVLCITIDPDKGERYQGIVPLDAENLAGCLEHYFSQSEQLKTRFWLSANCDHGNDYQQAAASGLMLQALPQQINASPEENQQHWDTACALADTVKDEELLALDHETLLFRLFNEEQIRLFEASDIRFDCSCSRQRSANALIAMGEDDVNQLISENEIITIDCQFCNQQYIFGPQDVTGLFSITPDTLH